VMFRLLFCILLLGISRLAVKAMTRTEAIYAQEAMFTFQPRGWWLKGMCFRLAVKYMYSMHATHILHVALYILAIHIFRQ
jgi:hypothetical protein